MNAWGWSFPGCRLELSIYFVDENVVRRCMSEMLELKLIQPVRSNNSDTTTDKIDSSQAYAPATAHLSQVSSMSRLGSDVIIPARTVRTLTISDYV